MLTLAPIISNHAILQRNADIRIFGEAEGRVTGSFAGQSTAVEADGSFVLHFEPMEAGGPYTLTVSCGQDVQVRDDIYIGDVVLISGQSNMQMDVGSTGYDPSLHKADPLCRFFHAPRLECASQLDNQWNLLTKQNAPLWSAIGYHLGCTLRQERNVPIGIIGMYQGAAVIQAFLSPESNKLFSIKPEDKHPDHTHELFSLWNKPATLYRSMLLPLLPYAISGVVWYQGESNTSIAEGNIYDKMLRKLITDWRLLFRSPYLPFVIIQINDYLTPFSQEGWKAVQTAQEKTVLYDRHTRLVKISDLGEHDLIHPTDKQSVADRIFEALKTFER